MYMLSTKCKDRTGRILPQGLDRTDQGQRGPSKKKEGSIFSLNGLRQALLQEIYYTTEKFISRFSQDKNFSKQLTVYEKIKDKLSRDYSFEAIRYFSRKRFCWVCFINL